jgi:siroheme synthase-like protein
MAVSRSSSLRYYPIFLELRGKPVLVVGAGQVGLRKTRGLLEAGALVTVVAPDVDPQFESLPVRIQQRAFDLADIGGHVLVFAATNRRDVNAGIAVEAKRRGIPANIADAPEDCDFIVPARMSLPDAQIAISTEGRDPRLAAALRRRLEACLSNPKVESK